MAQRMYQSSRRLTMISALGAVFVLGMLASTASAGSVVISQADTIAGCGPAPCTIPAHDLGATGVYGCTGSEDHAGRAPGNLGYVSYTNVCDGGQFSIDWRIEPLLLQFRNTAGDFQECFLESQLRDQEFPPLVESARRYFTCNMG